MFEPVHARPPTSPERNRESDRADLVGRDDAPASWRLGSRGAIENAIAKVLAQSKIRTPDIGGKASTEELGTAIAMVL